MGHESSLGSGLGGGRQTGRSRYGQQAASQGGIYLDTEETAGSPITYEPKHLAEAQAAKLNALASRALPAPLGVNRQAEEPVSTWRNTVGPNNDNQPSLSR